jgi:hypothetical protein
MNRSEFETLAEQRLNEAQPLLAGRHWSGAYYLCGYGVEFLLKARIARQFRADDIPDPKVVTKIYVHHLSALMNLAELKPELEQSINSSAEFSANCNLVEEWSEHSRYSLVDEDKATGIVKAVADSESGVFQWIRSSL